MKNGLNVLEYNVFNISIIAWHTSCTILEISDFDILKTYFRLVNESPVARNLNVTAKRSSAVTARQNFVSALEIFSRIDSNINEKSDDDILTKF